MFQVNPIVGLMQKNIKENECWDADRVQNRSISPMLMVRIIIICAVPYCSRAVSHQIGLYVEKNENKV